ncbi:MAG: hypothetical protein R2942_18950 [Ignavibacteria bacterium]
MIKPIGYDDLEPWYYAAEKELPVSGDDTAELGVIRKDPYPSAKIQ